MPSQGISQCKLSFFHSFTGNSRTSFEVAYSCINVNRSLFGCDFLQLGVVVAPHALKLPEEPITQWGEYWCEVTVSVSHMVSSFWLVKRWDWMVVALICPTDLFLSFCVQVNGLDTVKVPMSVVNFERPKTKRYKYWLAQQAAKEMAPTSSQMI